MEIEAKFIVPDPSTFERLKQADHLADYALDGEHTLHQHDTYLDTRDRRLLAAGYAVRLRKQDGTHLVTIKAVESAGGAIHRREEYEIRVPANQPPAEWGTSTARTLLLNIAGTEPLAPLFHLDQTRTVSRVLCGERQVGELSLDQVQIQVDGKRDAFLELEMELKGEGTEQDLAKIAAVLEQEWALVPEPRSKFERLLALADGERAGDEKSQSITPRQDAGAALAQTSPSTRPGISLDDTMAEAARKTLLFHMQRLMEKEPGTRAGDVEELHDMRVATRRMRAALEVFGSYIDTREYKPFARILRRAGRVLGAVRDLDVARENTQHYVDSLPPERRGELDSFLAAREVEHNSRRAEMIAFLDSDEYARFKNDFMDFLGTPGAGSLPDISDSEEPRPERVRHVLPVTLFDGYAHIRAFDEVVTAADVPLSRLHQLRIASKGLRYTLEFFQEVLAPDAGDLVDECKRLQDHLGTLQDTVVSSGVLRDFLMWGTWPRPGERQAPSEVIIAPGVAAYLAEQQNEIQRLVGEFPPIWADISGEEFRRILATLVAAL